MDFSQALTLPYHADRWQPSPAAGVWRYPLEREAAESGHVTSLVRFQPGAAFPEHEHPLGEEFWVLEGTFSDDNGDYGAGSYVRHPPGSRHRAFSRDGCVIFVKLNQFEPTDDAFKVVQERQGLWLTGEHGFRRLSLHRYHGVSTSLLEFAEGGRFPACCYRSGLEILVLEGELSNGETTLGPLSWLRLPPMAVPALQARGHTRLWVRTGHLTAASPVSHAI
ncbi:cupin domain-containing protein [Oceanimonas sp. CHS3-5]|uniref:cupin domain-containing protein n=1 Tax=Oceanimonas sp. CHS3-5 TaxID=3068186 RepID=UPI00273F690B|nr:cupin domain-containing protein [Oceanimonas sp. CHS3-5]MDP5291215.1 cupin domain-containing protein [Oceanimonas sp. CHS3-5]